MSQSELLLPVELDVLYEDDALIAINKPSGLLVHPSWIAPRRTPNCVSMIKHYLQGATVHTVHRLDRATSGVLLFAKQKEAARQLNEDFAERRVRKTYLCVVRGYISEEDVIDHALKEKVDKMEDRRVRKDKPAQDAVTSYKRLATVELPFAVGRYPAARYSLVECKPHTGRKHQIRRHMKHIFHPIVGDTKHGDGRHNTLWREYFNLQRLLLMATELAFNHPLTGELITLKAPVASEVDSLLQQMGWQGHYPVEQTRIGTLPVVTDKQAESVGQDIAGG
ncbi:MAG: RluA family pseudouridine synthase [Marinobacterium sp.]|nr:RluA family pseudouridine synthase [Marinobacterium sp.]